MVSAIDTIAKRKRLEASRSIYWARIAPSLSLGYRKLVRDKPGAWSAKLVRDGRRIEKVLGPADDAAAGADAIPYGEAIKRASAWAGEALAGIRNEIEAGERHAGTVSAAIGKYIAMRVKRDAKTGRDARSRLTKHVLGDEIAGKQIAGLTRKLLEDWQGRREKLAATTIRRTANDLRAALGDALPAAARKGLSVPESSQNPRNLTAVTDADIGRIIEAAYGVDPDLGSVVLLLAETGMRFSQVTGIRVRDVNVALCRIGIMQSAKGKKARPRMIHRPVRASTMKRLAPLLNGRAGDAFLLERWVHVQVKGNVWERSHREPWKTASEMTRGWAAALKATEVAHVEPYALRHASIIRGIEANVPLRVVAANHDTSTKEIERTYSAFIMDRSDALMALALLPEVAEVVELKAAD